MAKPFKPPPLDEQIINTLNPVNWFRGFITSNIQGDIDYHLTARDHSKITAIPVISPTDVQESAGFGPAGISVDPRVWFKYGFTNGLKGELRKLLKLNITLSEFDAYQDWSEGWKPALVQEEDESNAKANKMGLVKKIKNAKGETFLDGWVESPNASANEKQARLRLYNQLEWWSKYQDIKPYRDLAWTPIMESAIEAAYFTAERQRNEGTLTQAEFRKIESEFKRVSDKREKTSLRKLKEDNANKPTYKVDGEDVTLNPLKKSGEPVGQVKRFIKGEENAFKGPLRERFLQSIKDDQDYNVELQELFRQVITEDPAQSLINLGRDRDGIRLLEALRTIDTGESYFAWRDFLQKFDQGGTFRDYAWDSVTSVDLIRIIEPVYSVLHHGEPMPIAWKKKIARVTQFGQKTYPFNPAHWIASIGDKYGYGGLSKPGLMKFNNFAWLEFKEGRLGPSGWGARFYASQFEGLLWNKNKAKGLFEVINNGKYSVIQTNKADYFQGFNENQVGELGELLLKPDDLYNYLERLLDPSLSATKKATYLKKLKDAIDKYKGSEGYKTLQNLVNSGKLQQHELFEFLGIANIKGLSNEFQGFVGFASKLPAQVHNFIGQFSFNTWTSKGWAKKVGLNKIYNLWSKYNVKNIFFNSSIAAFIKSWALKAFGAFLGGPIGIAIFAAINHYLDKILHNIWAGLTGGKTEQIVGDNTKKMIIIGCAIALAPFALILFLIIIVIGGAFAWMGGTNNATETMVNQDVQVIVKSLDSPISTIINDMSDNQTTTFNITIKNNLDKPINVISVGISEYTEDAYWKNIKTLSYPLDIAHDITIDGNSENSTQITLPFYNAVKNGEDGRLVQLRVNINYTQADGGGGNSSGNGILVLGKVDQPIGTPAPVNSIDSIGFAITQCFGHAGHTGVDIGTPIGQPLTSTLSGKVKVCNFVSNPIDRTKPICNRFHIPYGNNSSAYGNMILVTNEAYTILYAHLRPIPNTPNNITDDAIVNVGDVIAYSGTTGNSTGPHVHYEVRLGNFSGTVMDPLQFASFNPCKK